MAARRFSSQLALRSVRRRAAQTPRQLANRFARLVERSPETRLDQLMRSPARRLILGAIFWQMPQHLDRARAAGVDSALAWEITGRSGVDIYVLTISDGRARAKRGSDHGKPEATITVSDADFLRLVTGNLDPMQAYFTSRIKLSGDLMLVARLQSLFRIPTADRAA